MQKITTSAKVLTKHGTSIEAAKVAPDATETRFKIEGEPGLMLCCLAGGARVWRLRYSIGAGRADRKERTVVLGDARAFGVAEASKRREELLRMVARGEDPKAVKTETFADLFEAWDKAKGSKLKSVALTRQQFTQHIAPHLGSIKLADVDRRAVKDMRDAVAVKRRRLDATGKREIEVGGAVLANRCLTLVQRVLNWGVDEGLLEVNLTARTPKVAGAEKSRSRVVAAADLSRFWTALGIASVHTDEAGIQASEQMGRVLKFCLLTGARISEVLGMVVTELRDLDGDEPVWILPSQRAKNGKAHAVPLCPMALACIQAGLASSRQHCKSSFVFASAANGGKAMDRWSAKNRLAKVCARHGIEHVSPHDLRRTAGTFWAQLRIGVEVRSALLNHTKTALADAVYSAYDGMAEKREALLKWEAALKRLLDGQALVAGPVRLSVVAA
jgi:integrase